MRHIILRHANRTIILIIGIRAPTHKRERALAHIQIRDPSANTLEDIASLLPEHNRLDDNTGREAALENFA